MALDAVFLGRLASKFSMVTARLVGIAFSFFLTLYLARVYGPEYSGEYYYFISVLTIVALLTRLGSEQYLISQLVSRVNDAFINAHGYSFVLSTFAASTLLLTFFLIFVMGALYVFPLHLGGRFPEVSIFLFFFAVSGFNAIWILGGYYRAVGRPIASILYETAVIPTTNFFILIANEMIYNKAPSMAVVSVSIGMLIFSLPLLGLFQKVGCGKIFTLNKLASSLRGILAYSSVTLLNSAIVWLPILYLGFLGFHEDVAQYNVAFRLAMLVGAFGIVVKSSVISDEQRGVTARMGYILQKSVIVFLPFLFLSFLSVPFGPFVASIFGDEFAPVANILFIVFIAQSVNISGYVSETVLVLLKERRVLARISFLTLVVTLISAPILVEAFHLIGAALLFLISTLFSRGLMTRMLVARLRST